MVSRVLMQARTNVTPQISELVVATVSKAHDVAKVTAEVGALVNYVEHIFLMRAAMRQRKQWEDDRQAKVTEAIAKAMRLGR